MNRLLLSLAITTTVGSLLSSIPTIAQQSGLVPPANPVQIPPPAPKAASVQITTGPALELARDDTAIIRWVTNNPGGSDGHVGIVRYGTDPKDLSQTARSPITVNRTQQLTTFRVSVNGLNPGTTYYYTVTSMESNGTSDGAESPVNQFTMPSPG
jgi:hypothetical protein